MEPNSRLGRQGGDDRRREDAVLREYARLALQYDRRWSRFIHASVQETLNRVEVYPHLKVLDVGCGTGTLFQMLLRRNPSMHLVGLDLCSEMLGVARHKLGRRSKLVTGRAQQLPFASESFDLVVSCNSFHFWHEPQEALLETLRVVKRGGKVVITDWCDDYLACRVCGFLLQIFRGAHFKTYRLQECERLLSGAGYVEISVERYKIDWLWGLMTATAQRPTR